MVDTLEFISEYYRENAKGIVWEHNTHIGDARATDMAKEGLVNVGQLSRERFGINNMVTMFLHECQTVIMLLFLLKILKHYHH